MCWYQDGAVDPQAFAPRPEDTTGLSVVRAKHKSLEAAAGGRPGKSYYVAVLKAGDLLGKDIRIVPRPDTATGYDPSHAEIETITYDRRKDSTVIELLHQLAGELCDRVEGPFQSPDANL